MSQQATSLRIGEALDVIKAMDLLGDEWAEPRELGRRALQQAFEKHLRARQRVQLEEVKRRGGEDRRNGSYRRHLLTSLGDIELRIPRTRTFSARGFLRRYARREPELDRVILAGFVLGLSTRKVGVALQALLGETVSATTVSRVARLLDGAVAAFHRRRLQNRYRALVLDGVALSRKTGMGARSKPILVALGITPEGRKEIIDFQVAPAESQPAWEGFLHRLYRRGLTGEGLEIVGTDGGSGLLAALLVVYPHVPLQRCWAHKVRNILNHLRRTDRERARRDLARIYGAPNRTQARQAARRFADRWSEYPRAVACLRRDLDELLTFFRFADPAWQRATRTTNAIERRFKEVRRRTRPMGAFADHTSIDRILYAVFSYENLKEGTLRLFSLTQHS
jgi:transposase-like protein